MRERGSYSAPKATVFLSYSRVQFSESYLGIILIPTSLFPPLGQNLRLPVWTFDLAQCKVGSCTSRFIYSQHRVWHKEGIIADLKSWVLFQDSNSLALPATNCLAFSFMFVGVSANLLIKHHDLIWFKAKLA